MPPLLRKLIRLQNPLMKWILRSPFHGFVSGFYLIVTVTGRKSGQRYEIPVQYHQEGETLWIVTSKEYRWWRNLVGGAPVTVYLHHRTYDACATPSTDRAAIREALTRIYPNFAQRMTDTDDKVALEVQLLPH